MPRGPVVATPVPGAIPQNPGDVIQSSVWNATVSDIYNIFNTLQPVEYGGSNASTPIGAFDNFHTASTAIPSATTTDLSTASGYYVEITGTTTITGFGTETAGVLRALRFSGILTLTHNATSLILPGAANITTAAGDTALFVSEGGGNWRCIGYEKANGQEIISSLTTVKGHVFGLTLSTNVTDASNDIDIAVGEAASDAATPTLITLATPFVKRLDASWAVGTNQGMLDTGAAANSTYYLWLIQRSDTIVVDVLASLSATSPTMPTNYDRKRLIGYVTRASGTNGTPVWYGAKKNDTGYDGINLSPDVPSTSGTFIDFTAIPSWARRINVHFSNVSTSGVASLLIQIGDSGGIETTGYSSGFFAISTGGNATIANSTGFGIYSIAAANSFSGSVSLSLSSGATNSWVASGMLAQTNGPNGTFVSGSKSLSATLDRVRVTTANGTDVFDAGALSISWE